EPFYLGIACAALGLSLSLLFVNDTMRHVVHEASTYTRGGVLNDASITTSELFALVSWRHPAFFSASQAGLVNNLNDGLAWGLFPLFFAAAGLSLDRIGMLAAIYPATWGVVQLATGALSDRVGRKWLIVTGMWVQAAGISVVILSRGFLGFAMGAVLLGIGTAMVYPTLLAA